MYEKTKKISPEEKLQAIKEYLSGKGSIYSIADKYGATIPASKDDILLPQEEKLRASYEYLQGGISLRDTVLKYNVGDSKWITNITPKETRRFFQNIQRSIIVNLLSRK